MERYKIAFFAFLLFWAVQLNAQFMPGNVVVHSDPRLAVLLKKNPTAIPPITPISHADEVARKNHNPAKGPSSREITKRSQETPNNQLPNAPTHHLPVAATSHEIAANIPKKPNAAAVHPFVLPPAHKDGRVIYAGKGFRVQIYNGNDREKAIKVKTEFMRLYPGMRTYLTYASPYFKVRVGDYRNRSDAVGMLKEANSMYPSPCMIVPDDITVHAY